MEKFSMLLSLAAYIIGGTIFHSCQKEETQQTPEKKVVNVLKAEYPSDGCANVCIVPDSEDYYFKTAQVTVQWGGKAGDNNTKVVDLKYYNTETDFVIEFKSTHSPQNLYIDDELALM